MRFGAWALAGFVRSLDITHSHIHTSLAEKYIGLIDARSLEADTRRRARFSEIWLGLPRCAVFWQRRGGFFGFGNRKVPVRLTICD